MKVLQNICDTYLQNSGKYQLSSLSNTSLEKLLGGETCMFGDFGKTQ